MGSDYTCYFITFFLHTEHLFIPRNIQVTHSSKRLSCTSIFNVHTNLLISTFPKALDVKHSFQRLSVSVLRGPEHLHLPNTCPETLLSDLQGEQRSEPVLGDAVLGKCKCLLVCVSTQYRNGGPAVREGLWREDPGGQEALASCGGKAGTNLCT